MSSLETLRAKLIIAQAQLRRIKRKVELLEDQIDSKGGDING
ncbi:hypothetical protein ES703_113633 [subsurface metagenome]